MSWLELLIWIVGGAIVMAFVLDWAFHWFSEETLKDLE